MEENKEVIELAEENLNVDYLRKCLDETVEKALKCTDDKLKLDYLKQATTTIDIIDKLNKENAEMKKPWYVVLFEKFVDKLPDLCLTLVPLLIKGYIIKKQTESLIAFETNNVGTYSATRNLGSTTRLPDIW